MSLLKAAIFDLDGVIVDTAKFHFLAWRRLAGELGFEFEERDNERLKGVSRMDSLDILLQVGGIIDLSSEQKEELASKKNIWYREYLSEITPSDILPGVKSLIEYLKSQQIKIALASASKNAPFILCKLGITELFDVVIDGNSVSKAKPDPEVFIKASEKAGVSPLECIVFEDAQAGVEGAKGAGMKAVGIGEMDILQQADFVIHDFSEFTPADLVCHIEAIKDQH